MSRRRPVIRATTGREGGGMHGLEGALRRMWRGEGGVGPTVLAALAAPVAVFFGAGVRARNLLYEQGVLPSRTAPVPVVSVGNLAVGGTGKTPVAAWVVRELELRGWRPALVTRGYGEDEILLHRRWNPEVPVIRAARRLEGAREARGLQRDIVVLDDGFQHRAIRRDLDIVLLSPAHPVPPRLLPRGPFRESLRALRRADHLLVTAKGADELERARALLSEIGRIAGMPPAELFPLVEGDWTALDGRPAPPPAGAKGPLVVTSVAEPEGFVRLVARRAGAGPGHLRFPDHHPYGEGDARRIHEVAGEGWVATTEKDAVKLLPLRALLPEIRVLPLVPRPEPELSIRLLASLGFPKTKAGSR